MVKITFLPKIASACDFQLNSLSIKYSILMRHFKIDAGGDGKQLI